MFAFLARIGKRKWARHVMPTIGFASSTGYMLSHSFLHNQARDLLAAQNNRGLREELSEHIKDIIVDVYNTIKSDYAKPYFSSPMETQPEIKWFCSSTLDPVNLGFTESGSGILIGLPNSLNYEKPEDVPQEVLHYKSLRFFRKFSEKKDYNDSGELIEDQQSSVGSDIVLRKDSEVGRQYVDSLILSKEAKQFLVARELFYADTYRVLLKTINIFVSFQIAILLSRALAKRYGLVFKHVSQRLPLYLLSGIAGSFHFKTFDSLYESYYATLSDTKAMSVKEPYRIGAVEYYEKVLARNKILKNHVQDLKQSFDDAGNPVTSFIAPLTRTPSERLMVAKKFVTKQESKSSNEGSQVEISEK